MRRVVLAVALAGGVACGESKRSPPSAPASEPGAATTVETSEAGEAPSSAEDGAGTHAGSSSDVASSSTDPPGDGPPGEGPSGPRVVDLFGINEAVTVPEKWFREGRLDAAGVRRHLEVDAEQVRALGARWVRVHTATWPFASWYHAQKRASPFDSVDTLVDVLQAAELEPLFVVGPWPGNQTANYTDRYVPEDMAGYRSWVRRFVERYDGDGQDDAPGLRRPVRFWEVDNEPDLHHRVPPRGARPGGVDPSEFQRPEEYAEVLLATAAAIRAADPHAQVLNAGIYQAAGDFGQGYLREVLAVEGVREAIDILAVHAYFEERTPRRYREALDFAEEVAGDKPVFITETGVPGQRRGRSWIDESWQARMLAVVYGEALARGVGRVFWHTLADPPGRRRFAASFGTHSLYRAVGTPTAPEYERKPCGEVFARLLARFGQVLRSEVKPLEMGEAGVLRMGAAGWFVYRGQAPPPSANTPWTPTSEVTDLVSGETGQVGGGSVVAPAVIAAP